MLRSPIVSLFLFGLLVSPTAFAQPFALERIALETHPVSMERSTPSSPFQTATAPEAVVDTTSPSEPSSEEDRRAVPTNIREHLGDYVGARQGTFSPYEQESAVYRMASPIRYNRAEGVVLGLQRDPLPFSSADRARVYGQFAYAFELRDLRYSVGVESRLYSDEATGLKFGALYQKQTLTEDRWKTSYLENSLASLGFGHDFFDYFEAEGVTLYAVQALPMSLRLTGGYRSEMHRSLSKQTNWSLFNARSFRPNPDVDMGRTQSAFITLAHGRVENLDDLPTGSAFRLAATIADSPTENFFTRYEADGRIYFPLTPDTRLALRMRGGYATSKAPRHASFSIGGIGTVRSYAQNRYRGTRMLLGNAEYLIDGVTVSDVLLDDLFLAGLLDAGWVGGPTDLVRLDEVLPAAGFGIGLDERRIRLDVSWPLRDIPGAGTGPSLWLRIAPNF